VKLKSSATEVYLLSGMRVYNPVRSKNQTRRER
jgi:hypothetical protein